MRIERVPPDAVLALRHRVLRAGLPPETARFEGDDEPATRHYAAVDENGHVVGCVTILRRDFDGKPAWQLRGMAVDPAVQARGVGAALLQRAEEDVRLAAEADPASPRLLWCNARVPAVAFYERHGWSAVSGIFDVPTAGPHRRMTRRL